jgi:type IV secretory pathway VirB2 component (pilin)
MLKKLIAYQRLLLNSSTPMGTNSQNTSNGLLFVFGIFALVFINISIFSGNTSSTVTMLPIALPVVSVWMINRILYGGHGLFETVPVSRKYIVLNVFLLSIVIIFIGYIIVSIFSVVLVGLLFGVLYIVNPQGFNQSPPEAAVHQIIDTTKGDILMLCILVIILFTGIAITFLKNKKLRRISFAGFAAIGYGLLVFLKLNMKVSPNSDKVEFIESFSIMPQGNTILSCIAIAAVIIFISSAFMGYYLYVIKPNGNKGL